MTRDTLPVLVLLPGSLCDAELWAAQARDLSDLANVITPSYGAADSVEAMAESVLSAVPSQRFAVAGFSLGGFVALELFRRAPDRISGLCLTDTTARPDSPETRERRLRNMARFKTDPQTVVHEFAQMVMGPNTPDALAAAILATMVRLAQRDYLNHQRAMMLRPDARGILGQVRCSSLVLCGGADGATPPALHEEMAEALVGSTSVVLSGVGHMTPLEAPEHVSAALRGWLANVTTAGK
ncbi:alpha/beta fold hydrolase [Agrobacterium vitis]|uniref:Alpha/beta fold hydrolase n=1 Tax=Agrobacterium vitis TaxID=373 RepID=A0A6L6VK01_AGRVI|nr:alpha/beta hydrolase [Agrobacterium vitis]MUZ76024.1 alpha/beta fold hydrolase [Agrobacterium vitis]